jgi:hypothetical protein
MPPFASCDYNSVTESKLATYYRSFSSDLRAVQTVYKVTARFSVFSIVRPSVLETSAKQEKKEM